LILAPGFDPIFGAGRVDAFNAVNAALPAFAPHLC
jgi:hypothetical protein